MHVAVDEARCDHAPVNLVDRAGICEAAGRMNAGNQRPDDADIRLAQLQRCDIEDAAAGQDQIERRLTLRGCNGGEPGGKLDRFCMLTSVRAARRCVAYSALMFAALRSQ